MNQQNAERLSRSYRRSPFLVLQWDGRDLVVTTCDTMRRFRVDERLVKLLRYLDDWATQTEFEASGLGIGGDELAQLVKLGIIECRESPDAGGTVGYWNCFDLAVQRLQNASGRGVSGTQTRNDPPPPAFKPSPPGPSVALPEAPELPGRLTNVLKQRRTKRTYSDRPLRLQELSGVLYHSVRVTATLRDDRVGDGSLRPFASGGARSELEVYVVANDLFDVLPGAYYYDARSHQLIRLREHDEHQTRLNHWLHGATGGGLNRDPQAVLLITAVFARVMWKYPDIGLALIYRDTGCLYQTLYLVADAFGLAPCAIGAGEELANSRWLGLDPLAESQVGCFLLGTR